jgi:hypothetical protein
MPTEVHHDPEAYHMAHIVPGTAARFEPSQMREKPPQVE